MRKSLPKEVIINARTLSKQQKNALDYWNGATNQLEKTSRALTKDVNNAIQSNNLKHMEKVIADAVKKLKDKFYLTNFTSSEKNQLKNSMSQEYDEALAALTRCLAQLRKKLQIVDKYLNRLSAEMTLYSALSKELRSLMKATVQAKNEKREHVASTVIALAPVVLSYIQTQ